MRYLHVSLAFVAAMVLVLSGPRYAAAQKSEESVANQYRNQFYLELFGPSAILGLHYERHVSGQVGMRAGVGTFFLGFLTPVLVHYRTPGRHGIEVGGGAAYFLSHRIFLSDYNQGVIVMGYCGYRYQKPGGRFVFRAGISPWYNPENGKFIALPAVSFGRAF